MASLEELLSLQQQTMNSITRVLPNFKKLGQAKMTPAVTRQRLTFLKETFQKCQELDGKINYLADEKVKAFNVYFKNSHFIACEDCYNETTDFFAEVLAVNEKSDFQNSGNVSLLHSTQSSSSHLPKLNLPTFDGSFDKWESFRDKFKSIIHNDPSLSDLKRLHYLCSCLTGDASNALNDIDIIESNFNLAWNRLVSRYENKRQLITFRLRSLLNLPTVSSETSKDLRDLRDQTNKAIHSLRNLDRPVEHWDDILVFLVTQKLDRSTKKAWELKLGKSVDYPKYSELDEFLESRICGLESVALLSHKESSKPCKNKTLSSHSTATVNLSCPSCKANHLLYQCSTFLTQTPSQRFEFIKKCKRCVNCFSAKHTSLKECKSTRVCKQCQKRHHTLLHFDNSTKSDDTGTASAVASSAVASSDIAGNDSITSHLVSRSVTPKSEIILATARVRVHSDQERFVIARALLDQGSVSTLISESLAQSLRLSKIKLSVCVTGIGDTQSTVRHAAQVKITPASRDGPAYSTTALILKSLTKYIPNRINSIKKWTHLAGLELADGDPTSNDPIDIIIGADLFGMLLLDGVRKGAENQPIAQRTTLGWIISGPTSYNPHRPSTPAYIHHGTVGESLDTALRRFWEIEEIPHKGEMSPEEQLCEQHFLATHSRASDGRYIIRLPFKSGPPINLGESRIAAQSSFLRLEQRLKRDSSQAIEYGNFMLEYELLGHMSKVPPTDLTVNPPHGYYIPHHAVLREDSATSRIRVVFNASCRTSNGTSLNDHLLIGPKLQTDLVQVITQWRMHQYVYTADIAKMYRQILVDSRDTEYQRILWRSSTSDPISEYRLRTVTYGVASAPYLALRVLKQLAIDEGASFPLALQVLRQQIYVDDCTFGADDKITARQIRDQLTTLLNRGGFRLRKWASNCPDLLADIDPEDHGLACSKTLQVDESLKILGIAWNPDQDIFHFKVSAPSNPGQTKRAILSTMAKFYDPLGWVAPVTVTAKIFMQQLWMLKCDWDDQPPQDLLLQWMRYHATLPRLEDLKIPRWINFGSHITQSSLHGFSDASTKAYAASVYLRLIHNDGSITVSLILAKTRVAPLKTISVPRLELAAANLLAHLMQFVQNALPFKPVECHCWTDSTITLAWINKPPSNWKTFVANRVSSIQNLLPGVSWHHVPTQDNPADCASRGLTAEEIVTKCLWWSGPTWLKLTPDRWPSLCPTLLPAVPGEESNRRTVCTAQFKEKWDLASRFSSWPRLLRVTAYVIRFTMLTRKSTLPTASDIKRIPSSILRLEEIQNAKLYWLKTIQSDMFRDEILTLSRRRSLPKSSCLISLNPYVDLSGLLRVGGRLRNSRLPEATRNPIVLRSHPILSLIINHHHIRTLHAGPQLTLASLRTEFWILRARETVRAVLHKCVPCTRERAKVPIELMGDLPDVRVNRAARAFEHTGVDYAGPILIRTSPGRGHRTSKAYIALFICLTVKAIHIELVSDYSSTTFIAAYHRFVARRGQPTSMYSDNGTTFHGADREMTDAYFKAIRHDKFLNKLATDKVTWHFLPPSAPHFGGLWEAGVKSVKYHLKRCIGNYTLTSEEMTTFLCRVEACLNSRPIAAVSDNIENYNPLTPGHFLIGTPMIAPPEPNLLDLNEARLSRWQIVQRCSEGFWKSWSSDYLQTLQQRPKWRVVQRLAKIGQIVLLRNPLAPPSRWELGRITACHPGNDNLIRVVTVKTSRSEYKRPLAKICFLPVNINIATSEDSATAGGVKL